MALLCVSRFVVGSPGMRSDNESTLTGQEKAIVAACSKMKLLKWPNIPFPDNWLGKDEKYRGAPSISYSIASDGTVHDVKLRRSSGSRKVDKWATDTIRAWKYKPVPECPGIESEISLIIDFNY
jgi:TonB family protein